MRSFAVALFSLAVSVGAFPDYAPRQWVAGHLKCAGSETMDLVVARWAQAFGRIHPAWSLQVDGKGSRVALRVLSRSGADFAVFSRLPSDPELAEAGMATVRRPLLVVVGHDTLRFLARRGREIDSSRLVGAFAGRSGSLRAYGRNLSSGTRAAAVSAMGGRDFGTGTRSLSSPSQVAQAVSVDPSAVGYSGAGSRLSRVEATGPVLCVRPLVVAVPARVPGAALREFLSFVLSRQGADILRADGFRPIGDDSVLVWRKRLGLDG